jgi:hypothetical protein
MAFNPQLMQQIRNNLIQYHNAIRSPQLLGEIDLIRRTTAFFANKRLQSQNVSFSTRSGNIDKSPIVRFLHTTPQINPANREVADILFVSKIKRNGKTIHKRGVLVQSKLTNKPTTNWSAIDTAQFFLMHYWPTFTRIRPRPTKGPYNLKPISLFWGTYAFVAPNALNFPLYISPSKILYLNQNLLNGQTFTFNPSTFNNYQTSPSFLMRLILCQIGENLRTNHSINRFVNELYRVVGLAPDPPDEFNWERKYEDKESNGLGVIEFTISSED